MNRKFSKEEKYQLVARYHDGGSVSDICTESGVARSTFYTWLKPYKTTYTDAEYVVSAAEFVKMKQRMEKLERKLEVLQKVNCTVSSQGKAARAFIALWPI